MNEEEVYFYGAPGTKFSLGTVSSPVNDVANQILEDDKKKKKTSTWAKVAKTNIDEAEADKISKFVPEPPKQAQQQQQPQQILCVYFQSGTCRFGNACRYKHSTANEDLIKFYETIILSKQAEMHDSSKAVLLNPATPVAMDLLVAAKSAATNHEQEAELSRNFEDEASYWQRSGELEQMALIDLALQQNIAKTPEEAEVALQIAERNAAKSIDCSICLENVVSIPGRRFGLLTNCNHAFCLPCLQQWRARIDIPQQTARSCPICRTLSYFVIPCDRFIVDKGRKAYVNKQLQQGLSQIPCRHFNFGKGTCPFGTSCFYAHILENGERAPMVKNFTLRLDADGVPVSGKVIAGLKLSEFL
jgi:Zinc finger, C3HC4 type (RING finger)/Zinc finger C-x8-C-x5-C-x3-H type (and similar)/RNA-binding, Nab2-type zinc finger